MTTGNETFQWAPTNAPSLRRHDDVWFFDSENGWAVNSDGKVIKTTDGGMNWETKHHAAGVYLRCIGFVSPQRGWVGTLTPPNILFETSDGGETWTPVSNLPAGAPAAVCGISVVNESVIYASGTNFSFHSAAVIKSTDGGATWTAIDLSQQATLLVDIHFRDENEGWVVGGKGPQVNPPNRNSVKAIVLHTKNGGQTWENGVVDPPAQLPNGEWGWKIFFVNDSVGYVSLENFDLAAVVKTTDGGETWKRFPVEDQQGNANLEGVGFIDPDRGWVGGWGDRNFEGGYSSATKDGAASWIDANEIGRFINRFRFIGEPLQVGYASGDTVYKYSKAAVPAVAQVAAASPLLTPASPSECGRDVAISYDIPAGTRHLTVDIWDRFGEHVCRLVDKADPDSGTDTATWRCKRDGGEPLPPGHYIYRVTADDVADSRVVRVTS